MKILLPCFEDESIPQGKMLSFSADKQTKEDLAAIQALAMLQEITIDDMPYYRRYSNKNVVFFSPKKPSEKKT